MRRLGWVAWAALLLGLLLLWAGNVAATDAFQAVGAFFVVVAAVLGIALMPFWARTFPPLPAIPDLALRPRPGQRWCSQCGRPAPRNGTCVSCGGESRATRRKLRRLQRKQRARPQEKKT